MTIYSDISFDPTTGNDLVRDTDSVFQSLDTLFSTTRMERLGRPDYYVDLEAELFDLITDLNAFSLYRKIIIAITLHEPRVILDNGKSDVVADPDNKRYKIYLYFTIRGLESQTFEYFGQLNKPTAR